MSSGFQLRFDILALARDILSERKSFEREMFSNKKEDGAKVEDPKPYTTEDVIKEAEKLYKFVLTKE